MRCSSSATYGPFAPDKLSLARSLPRSLPLWDRILSHRTGKPQKLEWEIYCPRMIPTMTAFGVLFFVTIIKAMWPLFGFLTPVIVFVLFIGLIMITNFVPF